MNNSTKRKAAVFGIILTGILGGTIGNPQWSLVSLPSGNRPSYDYSVETQARVPIRVLRALDGDTVELQNGNRLRYIGIDTPESVDKRKPVQCFAKEAARRNAELVEGKTITFEQDVTERDAYGRWLGYVRRVEDDAFINEILVKEGYAFSYSYPPDISKQDIFRKAERQAREEKRGLWAGCDVDERKSGKKQTNPAR